ncbi:MAG: TrkA family potassium uptake protein, partial [Ruminiclostridium sp.]|nr:TrkA family potassium uptake protein [Ruminiclostridium sp.]
MKTFVVIGLGRFGASVAEELADLGHQVLAVDTDPKAVQAMADKVTQAVTADCQDPEVLQALGVKEAHCAVVAFSDDIGTSVLITLNLKELGIP